MIPLGHLQCRIQTACLHTAEALTTLLAEILVHFIGGVDEVIVTAVPEGHIILLIVQRNRVLFK